MADSVGSVHVEFTTSTANFRAEVAKGAQAVEGFSAAAKRSAQGAAQAAGASGTYTASFGKLGEQVRGASASIGGFSQAFAALGAKASPAIKGMGSSLAALLAGGVTPLGIGIGLATTAISLFVGSQSDLEKQTEAATKALEAQKAKLEELNERATTLAATRASIAAGGTGSADEVSLAGAEGRLWALRNRRAGLKSGAIAAEDATAEINALDAKIALEEKNVALLTQVRDLTAEIAAMRKKEAEREKAAKASGAATSLPSTAAATAAAAAEAREKAQRMAEQRRVEQERIDAQNAANRQRLADAAAAEEDARRKRDAHMEIVRAGEAAAAERRQEEADRLAKEAADGEKGEILRPERIEEAKVALTEIEVMSARAADGFATGFSDAFASFATGAASASEAFKSFASSFLTDIVQMIAKQAALSALMGGASAVGLAGLFGGGAGVEATASLGGIGFATGGSFKVRGTGGTDSQPVAFWATPGEQVDVRTPGQMAKGGGGVTVNVFNSAPNTAVRTESREGPDGMEIRAYVEQVVSSDLERGGPISRTAERTHGLQRRGRRG